MNENLQLFLSKKGPTIAGIFLLIVGILTLVVFASITTIDESNINQMQEGNSQFEELTKDFTTEEIKSFYSTCGIIGIIASIFILLGAVLAFKRKMWAFTVICGLIGSISFFILFVPGILSILAVFLLLVSKQEFKNKVNSID